MASAHFGLVCCIAPLPDDCDQGAWPEEIYGNYGLTLSQEWRSFSPAELDVELRAGRPVEVYYEWTGGGAHVALITGRYENGDYHVCDSAYGPGPRKHVDILSGYDQGAWTMSYRTAG